MWSTTQSTVYKYEKGGLPLYNSICITNMTLSSAYMSVYMYSVMYRLCTTSCVLLYYYYAKV